MDYFITFGIIVAIVLMFVGNVIVIVPGKQAKILETFGKPHRKALMAGLHFKLPAPITMVSGQVSLQLQEIGADVSVKTKDNAFMTLPVKVQYRADNDPMGTVKAHYELENSEQQIQSYVLNNVRQTASGMSMIDLYQNRNNIESQVLDILQDRFAQFGFMIANVLVDEPQPSPEVRDAFNRVIASEREKEAAQNLADAERIKLVGVAQAEKESQKLQGEGLSMMRQAIAKGMHEAMMTLNKSGLSTEQALYLLMDTNRLDTLGTAASHGNLVLMDVAAGQDDFMKMTAAVKAGSPKK